MERAQWVGLLKVSLGEMVDTVAVAPFRLHDEHGVRTRIENLEAIWSGRESAVGDESAVARAVVTDCLGVGTPGDRFIDTDDPAGRADRFAASVVALVGAKVDRTAHALSDCDEVAAEGVAVVADAARRAGASADAIEQLANAARARIGEAARSGAAGIGDSVAASEAAATAARAERFRIEQELDRDRELHREQENDRSRAKTLEVMAGILVGMSAVEAARQLDERRERELLEQVKSLRFSHEICR